jgi:hypothetical protein
MEVSMSARGYFFKSLATSVFLGMLAAPCAAMDISGWTCLGSCGTLGANGVVTLSPMAGTSSYGWVSTFGSTVSGATNPDFIPASIYATTGPGATNGSRIQSPLFTANNGQPLSFYFNYITSDGSGSYSDYAWARLLDASGNEVAMLFAARTAPAGNTVPGFNMPPPVATLNPATAPIIAGAPAWSPLGGSSVSCYPGGGCGYTDWVHVTYAVPAAGTYRLELGAVNWVDTAYDSGLAFDGVLIGGTHIGGTTAMPVPANGTLGIFVIALLTAGLGAAGWSRRRRRMRG